MVGEPRVGHAYTDRSTLLRDTRRSGGSFHPTSLDRSGKSIQIGRRSRLMIADRQLASPGRMFIPVGENTQGEEAVCQVTVEQSLTLCRHMAD
jgi:hypothetical protein